MIIDNRLMEQFIGIYSFVYEPEYCEHLISEFERLHNIGVTVNRRDYDCSSKVFKADDSFEGSFDTVMEATNHTMAWYNGRPCREIFWDGLQKCVDAYVENFPLFQDCNIKSTTMKIQRTRPGEGYHVWHSEYHPTIGNNNRVLVFSLYLNNLGPEDGGETEFLYQKVRLKPEQGTVIIWPAGFTHTHRGNTVLGKTNKYIVTGWFHYEF